MKINMSSFLQVAYVRYLIIPPQQLQPLGFFELKLHKGKMES